MQQVYWPSRCYSERIYLLILVDTVRCSAKLPHGLRWLYKKKKKWFDLIAKSEAGCKLVNINATWFQHAWRRLYLQAVNTFLDRYIASSKTFFFLMPRDLHHSQDRWDHVWEVIVLALIGIVSAFNLLMHIWERHGDPPQSHFDGGTELQKMWPMGFPWVEAKKTDKCDNFSCF